MPRRRPPSPAQLRLTLEADPNQPPKAPATQALLEALAELLLAATGQTTISAEGGDEREDRS